MSGLAPLGVLFLTAGIITLAFFYYESLEKKDAKNTNDWKSKNYANN